MKIKKNLLVSVIALSFVTPIAISTSNINNPIVKASYVTPYAYRGSYVGKEGTHLYITANGAYVSFQAGSKGVFGHYTSSYGKWHTIAPKSGQGAAIKFSHGKVALNIAGQLIWCHKA